MQNDPILELLGRTRETNGKKTEMTETERHMHGVGATIYLSGIANFVDFNKFCISLNTVAFGFLVFAVEKFGGNPFVLSLLFVFCLYACRLCFLWRRGMRDGGVEVGMAKKVIIELEHGKAKGLFREKKTRAEKRNAAFRLFLKVNTMFRLLWLGAAAYILVYLPADKSLSAILWENISPWYDWSWKLLTDFLT